MSFLMDVKLICMLSCIICVVNTELTKELKKQIVEGLAKGSDIVHDLTKYRDDQVFNTIHKMSNFLGHVNGFVSFLKNYDPKTDKDDLTRMKTTFVSASEKLKEIRGPRKMGPFLRKVFFEIRTTEFSFNLLNNFLNKIERLSCTNKTDCYNKLQETVDLFKYDLDVKEHLDALMETSLAKRFYSKTSISTGLDQSVCEFSKIMDTMKKILISAFKAEQIIMFYEKITNEKFNSIQEINHWNALVYKLREKTYDVIRACHDAESCKDACGSGKCVEWPKINLKTCSCPAYTEGQKCQIQNHIDTIEKIFQTVSVASRIPKLADTVYSITNFALSPTKCIHETFENVNNFIVKTTNRNHKSVLHQEDLGIYYSSFLKLQYYTYKLKGYARCNGSTPFDNKAITQIKMFAQKFPEILYNTHKLIAGTEASSIVFQEPILEKFILRNFDKYQGCSSAYKKLVDSFWQGIQIMQLRGYLSWLQTLNYLSKPTSQVLKMYSERLQSQLTIMNNITCFPEVSLTPITNCNDGYYITQNIPLSAICKSGYYRVGLPEFNCQQTLPKCTFCNCNKIGSTSTACNNESGICSCKKGYYGTKCDSKDCVWSIWNGWATCNKPCNYGSQKRFRSIIVHPFGKGQCLGNSSESRRCIFKCCEKYYSPHGNGCCRRVYYGWRCD
ncbi:uncharacterized protein LOC134681467 [Mytilus trossulus]|uniref:uncharacterized protein LOC134681467 n=1 Tax=Mytilus trossulus TaxID=6551 RepID=UPI003005663D